MPETISNELIYEVLKNVQNQVSTLREDMEVVKARLSSLERRMGEVKIELGHVAVEIGALHERVDGVEVAIRSLNRYAQATDAFEDERPKN